MECISPVNETACAGPETATDTVNIYHSRADNVGDRMCGPAQFFWPDRVTNVTFAYELTAPENAIVGGGQVFGQTNDLSRKWVENPTGALVAWGVAVPLKGKDDALVRDVSSRFGLFGTRNFEWHDELAFVPCASCMSPAFDNVPAPTHEFVMYVHQKKTPALTERDGVPFMTNKNQEMKAVVDFLASGETVVTSSYHGVYWAQLLGRKVVCVPYSQKFSTLQHKPFLAKEATWTSALGLASRTEPLLDEYREINRKFAVKVAELLDLDG
ncbi:hypothetical protein [uncultured Roseobacter sp.]|uniref:hypothetical protein n=1 Tax=uncultured Roseobacter sp. TaxID=114847 RepID=UPI00260E2977|nr:hypothetical protein [uncultured Roseobacter sp.]